MVIAVYKYNWGIKLAIHDISQNAVSQLCDFLYDYNPISIYVKMGLGVSSSVL